MSNMMLPQAGIIVSDNNNTPVTSARFQAKYPQLELVDDLILPTDMQAFDLQRQIAGVTQLQALSMMGYKPSMSIVSRIKKGEWNLSNKHYTLFVLGVDLHPTYQLLPLDSSTMNPILVRFKSPRDVKDIRIRCNMTMEQFAKAMDITLTTMGKYERAFMVNKYYGSRDVFWSLLLIMSNTHPYYYRHKRSTNLKDTDNLPEHLQAYINKKIPNNIDQYPLEIT